MSQGIWVSVKFIATITMIGFPARPAAKGQEMSTVRMKHPVSINGLASSNVRLLYYSAQ